MWVCGHFRCSHTTKRAMVGQNQSHSPMEKIWTNQIPNLFGIQTLVVFKTILVQYWNGSLSHMTCHMKTRCFKSSIQMDSSIENWLIICIVHSEGGNPLYRAPKRYIKGCRYDRNYQNKMDNVRFVPFWIDKFNKFDKFGKNIPFFEHFGSFYSIFQSF